MNNRYLFNHGVKNPMAINLPRTPKCKVIYTKVDGVKYAKIIDTPYSRDALQIELLRHKIALSQLKAVEAV